MEDIMLQKWRHIFHFWSISILIMGVIIIRAGRHPAQTRRTTMTKKQNKVFLVWGDGWKNSWAKGYKINIKKVMNQRNHFKMQINMIQLRAKQTVPLVIKHNENVVTFTEQSQSSKCCHAFELKVCML